MCIYIYMYIYIFLGGWGHGTHTRSTCELKNGAGSHTLNLKITQLFVLVTGAKNFTTFLRQHGRRRKLMATDGQTGPDGPDRDPHETNPTQTQSEKGGKGHEPTQPRREATTQPPEPRRAEGRGGDDRRRPTNKRSLWGKVRDKLYAPIILFVFVFRVFRP